MEGQQVNSSEEIFANDRNTKKVPKKFEVNSRLNYGQIKVLLDILYDCSVNDRSYADSMIDLLLEIEAIVKEEVTVVQLQMATDCAKRMTEKNKS